MVGLEEQDQLWQEQELCYQMVDLGEQECQMVDLGEQGQLWQVEWTWSQRDQWEWVGAKS